MLNSCQLTAMRGRLSSGSQTSGSAHVRRAAMPGAERTAALHGGQGHEGKHAQVVSAHRHPQEPEGA